jgi:hypothetical protein
MREAVTLVVFLAAVACGGIWLLQDDSDAAPPGVQGRGVAADYRPGPAWLHRRLGQTISIAPFRALTNAGAEPMLGAWTPLP